MITLYQLSMRFGAKILFKNVSLQFNTGSRYGLVGANGCGKSTLIKLLIGEECPEHGSISFPHNINIGALSQNQYLFEKEKILDVVLQGKGKLWNAIQQKRILLDKVAFDNQDCESLVQWEKVFEEENGYSAEGDAAKLLEGLGIRSDWHSKPLEFLSGGYKLRVLLAQVLFGNPDVMVLDEPTNHLDLHSIKWLQDYLRNYLGTLIVASHDREFLDHVSTHIADVDYGTIKIYKGSYEAFLEQKVLERELKENMLDKCDKRLSNLQGFIDRFGAKASKAKQAQSKAKIVEKIEEEMDNLDLLPSSRIYPVIHFDPLRASGNSVLSVKNLYKAYGSKKVLENVSFEIERGERAAVIGPNGIGKSTLLEIITDHINPESGSYAWGFAARSAYFPQDHSKEFIGGPTLLDWLGRSDSQLPQEKLRDILGKVLFSGDRVNQSVETLSGGEKARLILAKMMLQKPNVLIFDEPTNHLDMEAIEELIKALESFQGTLIFVSHNRYFVSRLANRVIEISYEGVSNHKGSYTEYLEKREADYLNTRPILSRRYQDQSLPQTHSSSYEDGKRLKSLKAQLKKKISAAEERIGEKETKIAEIETLMSSENFYQKSSLEEQQDLVRQKKRLEDELTECLKQWEAASLELQSSEEES